MTLSAMYKKSINRLIDTFGWSHSEYSTLPHTSQHPHESLTIPATQPLALRHSSGLHDKQSWLEAIGGISSSENTPVDNNITVTMTSTNRGQRAISGLQVFV